MTDAQVPGEPIFSVVIPVFNKAPHLRRCLDSVFAQTEPRFEIVAVDDASTDGSGDILASYDDPRLRRFSRPSPGPGPSPARNLAIAQARAPWLAFLDADDAWMPRHLEWIEAVRRAHGPEVGCIFTAYAIADGDGEPLRDAFSQLPDAGCRATLDLAGFLTAWLRTGECPIWTSAAAIRTDVMRAAGAFPERHLRGEDKDTWLRVMTRTLAAPSHQLSATYYRNSVNMVTDRPPENREHCLCSTVRTLLTQSSKGHEATLLKRVNNLETLTQAKLISRFTPLSVSVFRHFYVLVSPIWFILIVGMWLVPARKDSRLRRLLAALARPLRAKRAA